MFENCIGFELNKMSNTQFDSYLSSAKTVKQIEEMIDKLIDKKMLLEKKNDALGWAIEEGDIESVKKHIENGADVNGININVAMILSALNEGNCNLEMLKTLIDAGADVNVVNKEDGSNALLWLVEGHDCGDTKGGSSPIFDQERIDAIQLLLLHGADPHVEDSAGISAYNYSEYSKNLIDSLEKKKIRTDFPNHWDGTSPSTVENFVIYQSNNCRATFDTEYNSLTLSSHTENTNLSDFFAYDSQIPWFLLKPILKLGGFKIYLFNVVVNDYSLDVNWFKKLNCSFAN